jgi:1-acyl-sn-glycerol-3-phosphate acyltransferase
MKKINAVEILKTPFILLWKIWFFLVSAFLVLLSISSIPFLFFDKHYPIVYKIHRLWGKFGLLLCGIFYQKTSYEKVDPNQNYIIIANHRSLIDIMLIYWIMKKNPLHFIGKAELAKLPVFGFIYKKSNILVDRKSLSSRTKSFKEAKEKIGLGRSICIFPEGGIPKHKPLIGKFHDGAFSLAIEKQLPILAFSLADTRKNFPYKINKGGPGKIYAYQHPIIFTKGLSSKEDKNTLKEKIHQMMCSQLEKFQKEGKLA